MKEDSKMARRKTTNKKTSETRTMEKDWDSKRDKDELESKKFNPKKSKNDPKWYGVYPELLRDSASIPFSWSTGTAVTILGRSHQAGTIVIPGIQAMELLPSIGYAESQTDPVNVAATSVYSFVRHANSGSANYDSPDLMLYLLAMSQVYSAITWLERIYAEATLYSQRNRYLPRGLVFAENVDFDDVQQNLADFRYGINLLIHKAASLSVPADMTIFTRHAFLYQNIYTEGTSIKDQLYMYVPAGFWRYQVPTSGGAGSLVTQPVGRSLGANVRKVSDLLTFVSGLLNPILQSEDMNIMSGDILKAYGADRCIKLTTLDEIVPIAPIFDIGVLEQMKNADIVWQGNNEPTNDVTQNVPTNALVSQPRARIGVNWTSGTVADDVDYATLDMYLQNSIITTTTEDVSPELVMESTRLKSRGISPSVQQNGNFGYVSVCTGTEFCTQVDYIVMKSGSPSIGLMLQTNYKQFSLGSTLTGAIGLAEAYGIISNFDFAPLFQPELYKTGDVTTYQVADMSWDVDNYAVIDAQTLERMHESALLSEFAVPVVNKV